MSDMTGPIADYMMGRIDADTAIVEAQVLFRIQRDIFCPITGKILDVRTAVAVMPSGTDDVSAAIHPDGVEQARAKLSAAGVSVVFRNPDGTLS